MALFSLPFASPLCWSAVARCIGGCLASVSSEPSTSSPPAPARLLLPSQRLRPVRSSALRVLFLAHSKWIRPLHPQPFSSHRHLGSARGALGSGARGVTGAGPAPPPPAPGAASRAVPPSLMASVSLASCFFRTLPRRSAILCAAVRLASGMSSPRPLSWVSAPSLCSRLRLLPPRWSPAVHWPRRIAGATS